MAETVKLPKWGLTMEEATIVEWLVEEDETVEKGEIIAEVEAEKANIELPSPCSGVVAKILVEDEEVAAVGDPLMIIASSAEEAKTIRENEGS